VEASHQSVEDQTPDNSEIVDFQAYYGLEVHDDEKLQETPAKESPINRGIRRYRSVQGWRDASQARPTGKRRKKPPSLRRLVTV